MLKLRHSAVYDTDKTDGYLQVYSQLCAPFRDSATRIMELGVKDGGSLRLLRDYFKTAMIVGIDLRLPIIPDDNRILLEACDQYDRGRLDAIAESYGNFDMIIDDCSHLGTAMAASFSALWKHVKPGGYYVIEDWGVAYWPGWHDSPLPFIHSLINQCAGDSDVWSVSCYSGSMAAAGPGHLCVMQKRMKP